MAVNGIKTNFNDTKKFHVSLNDHKPWYSDNDEDCSCDSCECSISSADEDNDNKNMIESDILRIQKSLNNAEKHDRLSSNTNRPSIGSLQKSSTKTTQSNKNPSMMNSNDFVSTKRIDKQITDQQKSCIVNIDYIYQRIDQSYTKLPILYNSIKHTKLDTEFILSVNDYLDRLKANIYKDLIRRETLLHNGKNHTEHLISLLRCICKISYEQSLETSTESDSSSHAILYTMTAIDYILQQNFPQKKPLFNYILNEYISMWLHENLRRIQEDFCIIEEYGTKKNFFSLCICLFRQLESLCAVNWERLQIIQNYRLNHFDQLMKPTSSKLETNTDFISLFGKPIKLTMKRSEIPVTPLYVNRTDMELINIDEIHDIFRKSIAQILFTENEKLSQSNSQEKIKSITQVTSSVPTKSIDEDLNSKNEKRSQSSLLNDDQLLIEKEELNENLTSNVISDTHKQLIDSTLLSRYSLPTYSSTNQSLIPTVSKISNEQQKSFPSEFKLDFSEHPQFLLPVEITYNQVLDCKKSNLPVFQVDTSSIPVHQPSSESNSSLLRSQTSIEMKNNTSSSVKMTKHMSKIKDSNLSLNSSSPIILRSSKHSNTTQVTKDEKIFSINPPLPTDYTLQEPSTFVHTSSEKSSTHDHLSSLSYPFTSDKDITMDSTTMLNAEINALILYLTNLINSSAAVRQEEESLSLLQQLETSIKQNNIDSNSIIATIHHTNPQSSVDIQDPGFVAAFIRVLRKELEDAQVLRKNDRAQTNNDSQNISYPSFDTKNTLKPTKTNTSSRNKDIAAGDTIEQDRVFIEVTHDPSKCTQNSELCPCQYPLCTSPQYHRYNQDHRQKSTDSADQQPSILETDHPQQRSFWIRSNTYSTCEDCAITPNSLFCVRKSFDKNTHSITVEHNKEQFM